MFGIKLYSIWVLVCLAFSSVFAADLELSWIENTEPDLAGYYIYYGNASGQYNEKVKTGPVHSYVLNNLQNRVEYYFALTAYDTVGNESGYSAEAFCVLNDTRPLQVDSISVTTVYNLLVHFNKKIRAVRVDQFSIEQNIPITNVELLPDHRTVRLITANHEPDRNYTLNIAGIHDIALPPNTLSAAQYTYFVDANLPIDGTEILLEYIEPESNNKLHFIFNKPLVPALLVPENYRIDPEIQILTIEQLTSNQLRVHTSKHATAQTYTVQISLPAPDGETTEQARVRQYYYNISATEYKPPVVDLVYAVNSRQVQVLFDKPIHPDALDYFQITNGVQITGAELDDSNRMAVLKTTTHQVNKNYTLQYSGGDVGNIAGTPQSFAIYYEYNAQDTLPPAIQSVQTLDANHVKIMFTEPVALDEAVQTYHFQIEPHVDVFNIVPGSNASELVLQTSRHTAFQQYEITVLDITDQSVFRNKITTGNKHRYIFSPDNSILQISHITIRDSLSLDIVFNKALDVNEANNVAQYQFNHGLQATGAQLLADMFTVRITTQGLQENMQYELQAPGNLAATHTTFQDNQIINFRFQFNNRDENGPFIRAVYPRDEQSIFVMFNELPDRQDAESPANYEILEGIKVLDAQLNSANNTVLLYTGPHTQDAVYTLQINNIAQANHVENISKMDSQFPYAFNDIDKSEPMVRQILNLAPDKMLLLFNEPLSGAAVSRRESYHIENNVSINKVQTRGSNAVEILTSPQTPGDENRLTVRNIADKSGNIIREPQTYYYSYNGIEPYRVYITDVTPGNDKVTITFSHDVDSGMAENPASYKINGNALIQSARVTNTNQVELLLDNLVANKGYDLWVGEINDAKAIRKTMPGYYYFFNGTENSNTLALEAATMQGANQLLLSFNHKLDWTAISQLDNYQISPDISVTQATLLDDDRTILLETGAHHQAVPYQIHVDGLKAMDSAVQSTAPIQSVYTYFPVLDVLVPNITGASLDRIAEGQTYYLDRDYTVTHVPELVKSARLVKTANNDKKIVRDDYMVMQLTEPAVVYIAYDMRANTAPAWLQNGFQASGMTLGVTDEAEELKLWRAYVNAGKLVLGGNAAPGARGVESMYVVLIDEPTVENMQDFQPGTANALVPDVFEISENYPNPFNPVTHIKLQLIADQYVRLTIYNILGQRVATLVDMLKPAGYHLLTWNGTDYTGMPVAAGTYLYRFEMWQPESRSGQPIKSVTRKMLLLK